MDFWLQVLFTGVSVGVVYGIVGAGYVVIHRITGMVNFAQGHLAVAGALGAVAAANVVPVGIAVPIGGLVGALLGVALYRFAVHPVRNHGLLVQTIVTLGAGIAIQSAAQLIFGTQPYKLAPFTSGQPFEILGAFLPQQTLWLIGIAVVTYVLLSQFFDNTMTGRALSACAVNRYAAGVVGINVVTMATIAFAISGGITGVIGAAQTPLSFASVGAALALGLKGFIAAILGGFDRLGIAILGGVLVGVVESLSAALISTSYQDVIVLSLLLILLVARPAGLTRLKVSERV